MSNNVQRLLKKLVLEAMSSAQESTGTRIQREEKLAREIAEALDEQDEVEVEAEEETEEETPTDDEPDAEVEPEAEVEVDVDVEEEVVDEPAEEEAPKAKRKMSTPKIAVGTTYKDFKHNFNAIRSAKAISKTINGEMMITKTGTRLRNYFEALTGAEKKALQEFMVGLSQVLLVGTPADDAVAPDIKSAKPKPTPKVVDQNVDVEIGTPTPVRIVGSKLESLLRLRRKNM